MSLKEISKKILPYLFIGMSLTQTYGCLSSSKSTKTETYLFENQELQLTSTKEIHNKKSSVDSTALEYINDQGEKFQLRVSKDESIKWYTTIQQEKHISFKAEEIKKNYYKIQKNTIK